MRINIGYVPAYGSGQSVYYLENDTVWLYANGSSSNKGFIGDFVRLVATNGIRFAPHPAWDEIRVKHGHANDFGFHGGDAL